MTFWLTRAGKNGELEDFALDNNAIVYGDNKIVDAKRYPSKEELVLEFMQQYPQISRRIASRWAGQLWAFAHGMQPGDYVALPLRRRPEVAFGRITGNYIYNANNPEGARHTRPVTWLRSIPRTDIDNDILYFLGARLTVRKLDDAELERKIINLLSMRHSQNSHIQSDNADQHSEEDADEESYIDVEEFSLDQIRNHIKNTFEGRKLENLVAAILRAKGYVVRVSPPGPDGGVDILAGSGPLGMESPKIVVQVKNTAQPATAPMLQQLQGAIQQYGADAGLFVSWSGFTNGRRNTAHFFQIRLWDSNDLIEQIFNHYEDLPEEIRTEIPLKRIWILVPPDE